MRFCTQSALIDVIFRMLRTFRFVISWKNFQRLEDGNVERDALVRGLVMRFKSRLHVLTHSTSHWTVFWPW